MIILPDFLEVYIMVKISSEAQQLTAWMVPFMLPMGLSAARLARNLIWSGAVCSHTLPRNLTWTPLS